MGKPRTDLEKYIYEQVINTLAYYCSQKNGLNWITFGWEAHITRDSPMRDGITQQTIMYLMPATDGIIIKPELTWTYFDSIIEAFPSLVYHEAFCSGVVAYRGMEVNECWYFKIADPDMFPEAAILVNQLLRIYMRHTFRKCDLCQANCIQKGVLRQ